MAMNHYDADQMALTSTIFPCQQAEFPMGIALSLSKLPKATLQPLVDKMADKLPSRRGKLMNRNGRLSLIKSTLQAMPTYTTMCIQLPTRVLKAMIKIMKAFFMDRRRRSARWKMSRGIEQSATPRRARWLRHHVPEDFWLCPTSVVALAAEDGTGTRQDEAVDRDRQGNSGVPQHLYQAHRG
jgi:hypothetical protein